jgi:N-sulfoglucosamine sulfohydrolase
MFTRFGTSSWRSWGDSAHSLSSCLAGFISVILTWSVVWIVLSAKVAAADPGPSTRPNIVWIVAENFSLEFGCYGAPHVHTPHIDSLAAQGTRFTHVYATSPVCAPSRSAFMTGMYQTTTDTHNMRSHRNDDFRLPVGVRPVTHRLQEAGYFTANITAIGSKIVGTGKLDLNFVNEGPIYQSTQWEQAVRHQPFFVQINTPEAEYDIYDRQSALKQRVPWVGEEWHPKIATAENCSPPAYFPDHPLAKQEWARYLNSASGLDVRVGWILEQLEREQLLDNTIIIFFGDNGRMEPRGIHWCTRSGLHVPMIIRWPKDFPAPSNSPAGTVDQRVVSLLDVTATTLAMAGITRPAGMQSRVLFGAAADPPRKFAFSARDRIDETVIRQRSVTDGRYHYIRNYTPSASFATLNRYKEKCFLVQPLLRELHAAGELSADAASFFQPFPDEMLYDTQTDSDELHNLAASTQAEHQQALIGMRAALDTWIVETADLGEKLEPTELVAPFIQEMHDWFGTPAWAP